ncbi:hypothetical protein ACXQEC_12850, partial [Staphylococcus argenteus]
ITFKILNWIRPYKVRMIFGFIMSFLNAIFIALPIFLAAQIFNTVITRKCGICICIQKTGESIPNIIRLMRKGGKICFKLHLKF